MAQLKDLIVNGASQLIGDVYTSQIQISKLNALTDASATTYGAGSTGQVLMSNGTNTYWGTPAASVTESTVSGWGFTKNTGTVTSVRVQATSPVVSSSSATATATLNTTISLADGYGDTKNPYGIKTANYVLAGPGSGNAAVPTFRKLVAADIPSLTRSKISDFPTSMPASDVSAWAKAASKPTYTASEVGAAAASHTHGNLTNDGKITTTTTIANGDKLVIVDSDSTAASKITGSSIAFNGSTKTKALTQKGTWETFVAPDFSVYLSTGTPNTFYIKTDIAANNYSQMIYGYIYGNGYSHKCPIHIDFQAYNYNESTLYQCYHYDATNALGEISIIRGSDNLIYFKIVATATFQTFKIFIYLHDDNNSINHAVGYVTTAPTIVKEQVLTKIYGLTSSMRTTTAPSSSSTNDYIPTSKAVWDAISNINTDTKQNTVLATTSKAYLTGVTTAPTSTAQALTAVADTGVYLTTTAGELAVKDIMIVGSANSSNIIASDATNNIYAKVNNKISLVITDTAIRSTTSLKGQIDLGTSAVPWDNIYANKFYGDGSNLTNLPIPTIVFKDWTVN